MLRIISIVILSCLLCTHALQAQENVDDEVSMDILRSPTSPASSLIGISDGQIERPTDPTDFMIMLNQATNNFSNFPTSFAVDVAPAWLFFGDKIDMGKYLDSSATSSINQTLVLSAATRSLDSLGREASNNPDVTQISFGFKVSILRGKVGDKTIETLEKLRKQRTTLLKSFSMRLDEALADDDMYMAMKAKWDSIRNADLDFEVKQMLLDSIQNEMATAEGMVMDEVKHEMEEKFNQLKKPAEKIDFKRYGFKMDVAGGWVIDFPRQNFDNGKLSKMGIWTTLGWEWKEGVSLLGMARYLSSPDEIFADDTGTLDTEDIQTFDAGARLGFDVPQSKFTMSGEVLYRSVLNVDEIDPSWRFTLNAAYDFGKNKKVTLVFGRDFDGTITKDGNLIAALNILVGLGGNKKL